MTIRPSTEVALQVLVAMALTLAWVAFAGKDLSFDVINHHLYLPFAWWHDRHLSDWFAAGPQSYQNPLGLLPAHALVHGSTQGWVVGAGMGLLHALCAWPLAMLAQRVWPRPADSAVRWLSLALSMSAPIFLINAGTTSFDPISAALMLAALALWLADSCSRRRSLTAGLCLGAACGLKPSNGVALIALAAVVAWQGASRQVAWRSVVALAAGVVAGSAATLGPWAWKLWQALGNPFFPLFNEWFRSPLAPVDAMRDFRFIPADWLQAVALPLRMVELKMLVHTEAMAPDLRPLALALAGPLALAAWAWRKRSGNRQTAPVITALGLFFTVGWSVWVPLSGNSRYAIGLFMLAGLLLVAALRALLGHRRAMWAGTALLVAQLGYFVADGQHRYSEDAWSGPFLDVDVAPPLQEQPFLHLSIGTPSYAGLAAFLPADGAWINIVGMMSLPPDGPVGEAVQRRLQQWHGRTRVLFRVVDNDPTQPAAMSPVAARRMDTHVRPFGLSIDWTDCHDITVTRHPPDRTVRLRSCVARPGAEQDPESARQRAIVDRAFAKIEHRCPLLFGPRPMVTDQDGRHWQRRYLNTGLRVTMALDEGVTVTHFRSLRSIWLGSVAEVTEARGIHPCEAVRQLEAP